MRRFAPLILVVLLLVAGLAAAYAMTRATGNDNVRLAVQWAVALATGGQTPTEDVFKAPNFENSVTGKPSEVKCRPDLPGSIYLSAEMSGDDQAKAVGQ